LLPFYFDPRKISVRWDIFAFWSQGENTNSLKKENGALVIMQTCPWILSEEAKSKVLYLQE
jgi:hypothetical protein